MTTTRRIVLKGALAAGGTLALPAVLRAASPVELTVVHGSPNKHVISAGGVEPWMEKMKELLGDQIKFNYYPGGQLANLKSLLNAVQTGVADAVPIPIGYVSDKMPLNGVSMLPGLGETAEQNIRAYGEVMSMPPLAKEFEANRVVPIWNMAYPPYQLFSTTAPILSVADFKGKVIRSAGGSMNLLIDTLGGSPAEMPAGDIYVAMERGTVDATLSSYSSVKGYGVQELCKSASSNGSFGTFTNVFAIAEKKWQSLPDDVKQAAMEAGKYTEKHVGEVMDNDTTELAAEFQAAGLEVYKFPKDDLAQINKQLETVQGDWVERLKGRGLPAQDVLDAYRAAVGS